MAFNRMLDPRELRDTKLDDSEIAAVSSFLAANVDAFSPLSVSSSTLEALLASSPVITAEASPDEPGAFLYTAGEPCDRCTVVLHTATCKRTNMENI